MVERVAKHSSREVRFFEASVLRLHFLEVCLTYLQSGQIRAAQITARQTQQVYQVPGPKALLRDWPITPTLEQGQQHPLRSVIPIFRL